MTLLRVLGLATGLVLLAACDQVSSVTDKASVCGQALGLANLRPDFDPARLPQVAADKAEQLRQLADQVADQDLKQDLFTLADAYVRLEQRKADKLADINQWVQDNADNLAKLASACSR